MRSADDRRLASSDSRARCILLAVLAIALTAVALDPWRRHARPASSHAASAAPTAALSAPRPAANPTSPSGRPSTAVHADTRQQTTHDPAPPEVASEFARVAFPVPTARHYLPPVRVDEHTESRRTDSPPPRVPTGTSPAAAQRLAEESRLTGLPPAASQRSPSNPGPSARE